jgi:protein gp37
MKKSKIEWTDTTLNSLTGCTKVSEGCKNCYMFRIVEWQKRLGTKKYQNGTKLTIHNSEIEKPIYWRKTRKVFVNSMSDFFHEDVPLDFIKKSFMVFNNTNHTYQILTKRSSNLKEKAKYLHWTDNIWIGVSVELQKYENRIQDLLEVPAKRRFLSCEPLLGELDLEKYLRSGKLHWVIVGGESDLKNPREMDLEWAIKIKNQCKKYQVPFFFKQVGGKTKCKCHNTWGCRFLGNITYDEYPKE